MLCVKATSYYRMKLLIRCGFFLENHFLVNKNAQCQTHRILKDADILLDVVVLYLTNLSKFPTVF